MVKLGNGSRSLRVGQRVRDEKRPRTGTVTARRQVAGRWLPWLRRGSPLDGLLALLDGIDWLVYNLARLLERAVEGVRRV